MVEGAWPLEPESVCLNLDPCPVTLGKLPEPQFSHLFNGKDERQRMESSRLTGVLNDGHTDISGLPFAFCTHMDTHTLFAWLFTLITIHNSAWRDHLPELSLQKAWQRRCAYVCEQTLLGEQGGSTGDPAWGLGGGEGRQEHCRPEDPLAQAEAKGQGESACCVWGLGTGDARGQLKIRA